MRQEKIRVLLLFLFFIEELGVKKHFGSSFAVKTCSFSRKWDAYTRGEKSVFGAREQHALGKKLLKTEVMLWIGRL